MRLSRWQNIGWKVLISIMQMLCHNKCCVLSNVLKWIVKLIKYYLKKVTIQRTQTVQTQHIFSMPITRLNVKSENAYDVCAVESTVNNGVRWVWEIYKRSVMLFYENFDQCGQHKTHHFAVRFIAKNPEA